MTLPFRTFRPACVLGITAALVWGSLSGCARPTSESEDPQADEAAQADDGASADEVEGDDDVVARDVPVQRADASRAQLADAGDGPGAADAGAADAARADAGAAGERRDPLSGLRDLFRDAGLPDPLGGLPDLFGDGGLFGALPRAPLP